MFKNFFSKIYDNLKTLQAWNRIAGYYNMLIPPNIPSPQDLAFYRHWLEKTPGLKNVLILGATPGLRRLLVDFDCKATLMDFSRKMYKALSKDLPPEILAKEEFIWGDWLNLKKAFKPASFDLILGDFVFMQIRPQDRQAFLDNLYAVLKPGGLLFTRVKLYNPRWRNVRVLDIIRLSSENLIYKKFRMSPLLLYRLGDKILDPADFSFRTKNFVILLQDAFNQTNDLEEKDRILYSTRYYSNIDMVRSYFPKEAFENLVSPKFEILETAYSRDYDEWEFLSDLHFEKKMNFFDKPTIRRSGFWSNRLLTRNVFFKNLKDLIINVDAEVLRKSQYWPKTLLEEIQLFRLKKILNLAYREVPFWRHYFDSLNFYPDTFQDFKDLEKIIPVGKGLLKKNYESVVNPNIGILQCVLDFTSGSSGAPFNFYVDRNYILRSFGLCRRIFEWAGWQAGDKIVRLDLRERAGFARDCVNFPLYISSDDIMPEMSKRLDRLAALGRDEKLLLFGSGSGLLRLANLADARGVKLNLRSVIYSADALTLREKNFIESVFSCHLFNCYACREIGWLAQECERGGLHINPEWCYLEVVDERGKALSAGQFGKIVVTTLDNEIMPFIRYDTGDTGRLSDKPCVCGRTLPVLEFEGRGSEAISLPNGQKIHLIELDALFEQFALTINSYQVIQEKSDTLILNLILRKEAVFNENEFRSAAKIFFGNKLIFSVNYLKDIPQTGPKRKILISKLNI